MMVLKVKPFVWSARGKTGVEKFKASRNESRSRQTPPPQSLVRTGKGQLGPR